MSEEQGQEPTVQDDTTTAEDAQAEALLAEAAQRVDGGRDGAEEREAPRTFDEAYVRKLRDESASHRVKAKELEERLTETEQRRQEQLDAIAKALGLAPDDAPPDPEELTRQLADVQQQTTAREAELRTLRTERAAERAARQHGADVDALLDSRAFADKLGKLDPSDEGFADAVSDLVKTAVEDNPKYKADGPAPAASSADFSGGTGERAPRPTSLFEAVKRATGA